VTYVWRNLFQRKVRTGLSMLGVSVSVAGIVAMVSVVRGMQGSMDEYMESTGASLLVFSGDVADLVFSKVEADQVEAIAAMDGVQDISRTSVTIVRPPEGATPKKKGGSPLLFCFGRYPDERIMEMYEDNLVNGRLFETRDEMMASRLLAERFGWGLNDTLPLFGRELEIVGIVESTIAWENQGLIVHTDLVNEKIGREDNCTVLFVYTRPDDTDAVKQRIEKAYPGLAAVPSGQFTTHFQDQLALVDEVIWLVTFIALVIGALGVLNTMMMSVAERTREIGMLRAVGWPRRLVVRTILFEGVLLSTIGGAIGLLLGVAGTETLLWAYSGLLEARYLASTFGYGLLVGVGVGISAAIYPAIRAANLRPVEALRYE